MEEEQETPLDANEHFMPREMGVKTKKWKKTQMNQKYSQSLQKKKIGSTYFYVHYLIIKYNFLFFLQIITVLRTVRIARLTVFQNCRAEPRTNIESSGIQASRLGPCSGCSEKKYIGI